MSSPDSFAMRRSMMARSGAASTARVRAAAPSAAPNASQPRSAKAWHNLTRNRSSSSTISAASLSWSLMVRVTTHLPRRRPGRMLMDAAPSAPASTLPDAPTVRNRSLRAVLDRSSLRSILLGPDARDSDEVGAVDGLSRLLRCDELLCTCKYRTSDVKGVYATYARPASLCHSFPDEVLTRWNAPDVCTKEGLIELKLGMIFVKRCFRYYLQTNIITGYVLARWVTDESKSHLCVSGRALGCPYQYTRVDVCAKQCQRQSPSSRPLRSATSQSNSSVVIK